MTPPRQPDASDAQDQADAAAAMERRMGLDTEERCDGCSGYRQPGEICCRVCYGHHRADDTYSCEFRQRRQRENEEAAVRWRSKHSLARKRKR